MNRRTAATAIAALALAPRMASTASANSNMLTRFIDDVIADGNVDELDQLVSPTVSIPSMGVVGIDEFREASIDGASSRAEQYDTFKFEIVSIAESDDYAHALVRFEGKQKAGRMEARHLFYVAQFRDGLIETLWLG